MMFSIPKLSDHEVKPLDVAVSCKCATCVKKLVHVGRALI